MSFRSGSRALILALAISFGLHALVLRLPAFTFAPEPETSFLVAELRPLPPQEAVRVVEPAARMAVPKSTTRKGKSKPHAKRLTAASMSNPLPESLPAIDDGGVAEEDVSTSASDEGLASLELAEATVAAPLESRLPPCGEIRYRVDRGDANFEIGTARSGWEIAAKRYRLYSIIETSGLIWLFKPYRIEMESVGQINAQGLQPDAFFIRRNGKEPKERAVFDWAAMTVRVADQPEQSLAPGAQDLLSFNFQLGFLALLPENGATMAIATGRKYSAYRLEVLGDEAVEVPAGRLRTLHLRAPGVNTTELWLAYDYLLLPVKIRFIDLKGDSLVQVATEILASPESCPSLPYP